MLPNKINLSKRNKGSEPVVCARVGGANTTSFLAVHFAKRNTKNCSGEKRNGESEGGQKFLPPNPLPFCPPERSVFVLPSEARQSVGVSFKKGSSFVQQLRPIKTFQLFRGKGLLACPAFGGARFAKSPVFRN